MQSMKIPEEITLVLLEVDFAAKREHAQVPIRLTAYPTMQENGVGKSVIHKGLLSDLAKLNFFHPRGGERLLNAHQLRKRQASGMSDVSIHSFVYTNYWSDLPAAERGDTGGSSETFLHQNAFAGEEMGRHFFHCATIWRPIQNQSRHRNDSKSDELIFEPQVLCLVTPLPYHDSFIELLKTYAMDRFANLPLQQTPSTPESKSYTRVEIGHLKELYEICAKPYDFVVSSSWNLVEQTYMKEKNDDLNCDDESLLQQQRETNNIKTNFYFQEKRTNQSGNASARIDNSGRCSREPPPGCVRICRLSRAKQKDSNFGNTDDGNIASEEDKQRKFEVSHSLFRVPSTETARCEERRYARCIEPDFRPLLRYMQPANVVKLFAALLLERSVILLTSARRLQYYPNLLFDACETLRAILFPLTWYHIYMPSIPCHPKVLDHLAVPVTYLCGACREDLGEHMEALKLDNCLVADLEDDVVLDAIDYLRFRRQRRLEAEKALARLLPTHVIEHDLEINETVQNVPITQDDENTIDSNVTDTANDNDTLTTGVAEKVDIDSTLDHEVDSDEEYLVSRLYSQVFNEYDDDDASQSSLGDRHADFDRDSLPFQREIQWRASLRQALRRLPRNLRADLRFNFDETNDLRLDGYCRHAVASPRSEYCAVFPPRYAMKVFREIRRSAPLFELRQHRRTSFRRKDIFLDPIELPLNASPSLRQCAAREAGPSRYELNRHTIAPASGTSMDPDRSLRSQRQQHPSYQVDATSLVNNRPQSLHVAGQNYSRNSLAALPFLASWVGHGAERHRSQRPQMTLGTLHAMQAPSSEEEDTNYENESQQNIAVGEVDPSTPLSNTHEIEHVVDDNDGVKDKEDNSTLDCASSNVVEANMSRLRKGNSIQSKFIASKLDLERRHAKVSRVRQVFFNVLTSLLKGYREHIRVGSKTFSYEAETHDTLQSNNEELKPDTFGSERDKMRGLNGNYDDSDKLGRQSSVFFDVNEFLFARVAPYPDQDMHFVPFMQIFLRGKMFASYMHCRAAAVGPPDALDTAIMESRTKRAIKAAQSSSMAVQKLGIAWKAKQNTHGGQFWGPQLWNERFFELHQHATAMSLSSNVDGGSSSSSSESKLLTPSLCEPSSSAPPSSSLATFDSNDGHDIISLVYYDAERWDLVEELERQVHNLELKKRAGSASSSYAKIEKDINAKKVQLTKVKAAKRKNKFILRKGRTALRVPETNMVNTSPTSASHKLPSPLPSSQSPISSPSALSPSSPFWTSPSSGILSRSATVSDGIQNGELNGNSDENIVRGVRGFYKTEFAFEIHVYSDKRLLLCSDTNNFVSNGSTTYRGKRSITPIYMGLGGHDGSVDVLTICCKTQEERRMFIRKLQFALMTTQEVENMRRKFLTPENVRQLHFQMKSYIHRQTAMHIKQNFPEPFQMAESSVSNHPFSKRLHSMSDSESSRARESGDDEIVGLSTNAPPHDSNKAEARGFGCYIA